MATHVLNVGTSTYGNQVIDFIVSIVEAHKTCSSGYDHWLRIRSVYVNSSIEKVKTQWNILCPADGDHITLLSLDMAIGGPWLRLLNNWLLQLELTQYTRIFVMTHKMPWLS